jgi:hypothetical protein
MAYTYRRSITVDYTKVQGSNQTDFPVLVSGTYSYLATIANGGRIQNANGYDIAFYSDEALTTQLDHETEKYTATTGEVVYWVRIPTLSYTVNTVFYIAYGDSGISTSQENITGVWDSNFVAVLHLGDGTTLSGNDSTSNNNDFTPSGSVAAASGKIGGCATFTTASAGNLGRTVIGTPTAYTLQAWVRSPNAPTTGITQPFKIGQTSDSAGFSWNHGSVSFRNAFYNQRTTSVYNSKRTNTLSANTWYLLHGTWTGSALEVYQDGTVVSGGTVASTSIKTCTGNDRIGQGVNNFGGEVEEFRRSSVVRSADWIKTDYNSQNSPSTFYTVGGEERNGDAIDKINNTALSSLSKVLDTATSAIKKILDQD